MLHILHSDSRFFQNRLRWLPNTGENAGLGERSNMEYKITKMIPEDWEQVKLIYQEGILTGNATFENDAPDWDKWDSCHIPACRFVARLGAEIFGWAALSPVSNRCVYSGVAEISVYVKKKYQKQGVGNTLLAAIINASELDGIWTLEAGIFPENTKSINLHKKYGFREIGRKMKLGKMVYGPYKGVWRDVFLLERRSKTVGID
jgi:L-amino acid N-acyltransferase YncA